MEVVRPPLELPRDPEGAQEALDARLAALGRDEAVLVRWRQDLRALLSPTWQWWPVVDGPSAWHFLIHRKRGAVPPVPEVREARRLWGEAFRLYRQAMASGEGGEGFARVLQAELLREEGSLFPAWRERTGDERAPRELGYEIAGIRKGLQGLEPLLARIRDGTATKRERDRYDIDFFHLVEHHVERLERSVFPALEVLLSPSGEDLAREGI